MDDKRGLKLDWGQMDRRGEEKEDEHLPKFRFKKRNNHH